MTATTDSGSAGLNSCCWFAYVLLAHTGGLLSSGGGVGGSETTSTVTEGFLECEMNMLSSMLPVICTAILIENV